MSVMIFVKIAIIIVPLFLGTLGGCHVKKFYDLGRDAEPIVAKNKELTKQLTACKNRNVSTAKEVMGKCKSGQATDVARQKFKATVKNCRKLIKQCRALAKKHEDSIISNSIDITR